VFDGGAGYFVRKDFSIGVAVSMFSRAPEGSVSVTTPDPIAFNSFAVLAASPRLRQTELGAHVKLAYHGLWENFEFGAFADDSEHRNELGPHAVRRALESHGVNFAADKVWVIGDTAHDIACGKAIGAHTLAVGTGGATVDQLRDHRPTAVVDNLADTAAVLRLFESR